MNMFISSKYNMHTFSYDTVHKGINFTLCPLPCHFQLDYIILCKFLKEVKKEEKNTIRFNNINFNTPFMTYQDLQGHSTDYEVIILKISMALYDSS